MAFKRTTPRSWELINKSIGKFSLIPHEEQNELFKKYKERGDISARDKLLTSTLRIIMKITGWYLQSGVPPEHLFQIGVDSFYDALGSYDSEKGFFVNHLAYCVIRYIDSFIKKERTSLFITLLS